MRILLVTAGSRGDIEPFVALARRARAEGHTALLVTPDNSGADTEGVETRSLGVDYSRVIEDQGVSALAALRSFRTVVRPTMRGVIVGAAHAAVDFAPDVIVYHPKVLSGPLIGDALGVPHVLAELVPSMTPTRAFPATGPDLGPLNRLTYAAAAGARSMFAKELAEASDVMGVRRHRDSGPALTLMPISAAILSRPDDWPPTVRLTGPWLSGNGSADATNSHSSGTPSSALPDAELDAFIAAQPFIYAGFGSMAVGDPEARGRALIVAARERGERLLLATGLGGVAVPDDLRGDDILVRRSVDHTTVLPRASAAIHHGGIGTVHAAVRAATVSIIVPFIADQPLWAARLHRAGLGPAPIPRSRLTAQRLSERLEAVAPCRDAIAAASAVLRAEDGTGAAVQALESLR